MLSNLIVTNQKLVLVIDEVNNGNRERIAQKFIDQLLHEQGQGDNSVRLQQKHVVSASETLLGECNANNNNSNGEEPPPAPISTKPGQNIILPTLADLLCYQTPACIFKLLNKLRRAEHICRIFLWASPQHLQHEDAAYILAGCEYMAELVLRLETESTLSLISRKPGGGVSSKRYTCQVTNTQFQVTPLAQTQPEAITTAPVQAEVSAEACTTFKIELDEDEVVARNALTLPYERTSEPAEGNIIYTPDADDDFDEEDPDEDLCI